MIDNPVSAHSLSFILGDNGCVSSWSQVTSIVSYLRGQASGLDWGWASEVTILVEVVKEALIRLTAAVQDNDDYDNSVLKRLKFL